MGRPAWRRWWSATYARCSELQFNLRILLVGYSGFSTTQRLTKLLSILRTTSQLPCTITICRSSPDLLSKLTKQRSAIRWSSIQQHFLFSSWYRMPNRAFTEASFCMQITPHYAIPMQLSTEPWIYKAFHSQSMSLLARIICSAMSRPLPVWA